MLSSAAGSGALPLVWQLAVVFFRFRACGMGYHCQARVRLGMGKSVSFLSSSIIDYLLPSVYTFCYLSVTTAEQLEETEPM